MIHAINKNFTLIEFPKPSMILINSVELEESEETNQTILKSLKKQMT